MNDPLNHKGAQERLKEFYSMLTPSQRKQFENERKRKLKVTTTS